MLGGSLDWTRMVYATVKWRTVVKKVYELLIIVNVGYPCNIRVSVSFIIKPLVFVSTKQISV